MSFNTFLNRIPNTRLLHEAHIGDGTSLYFLERRVLFQFQQIRLVYLASPCQSADIKGLLEINPEIYTLFVVDGKLLGPAYVEGAAVETPRWLQILHGLNFGQVYVWQENGGAYVWPLEQGAERLAVLHLDWGSTGNTRRVTWYTAPFALDLDLRRSDTWVHGFDGVYATTYFAAVPNWWLGETESHWTQAQRAYENARQRFQRAARGFDWAFMWEDEDPSDGSRVAAEPAVRFTYSGRMDRDTACRILGVRAPVTPNAVRSAYLDLVKQYHPDANPHPEATRWMQAINAARDYLED